MTIESVRPNLESSTDLLQERVKKFLDYDPLTGIFRWKVSQGRVRLGDVAGSENSKGYIVISLGGIRYGAHQLAWLYIHGKIVMIDHKDDKPWNNAIDNLREATYSQNNHKKYIHNPHGHTGVRFRSGAYQAHIRIEGVVTRIGSYKTAEEAGNAYAEAAKQHFGEFAKD